MKTATTLLQISKMLKLSPSTVSRALKNHPDIASGTRLKVLELAAKLDYEPNLNAVGLRTSESREIAVIVPNLSGFFYDSFISAVEEECRKFGYSLIVLLSGDDPQVEADNIRICKQRRVRGVLACITPDTSSLEPFEKLSRIEIPVIFFDKVPKEKNLNTVRVADEEAATLAAEYLLARDRKSVLALFGDLKMSISSKRLKAFEGVFRNADLMDRLMIAEAFSAAAAEDIVMKHFNSALTPDTIFCMSDEILIGVMKAVQIKKIRYPETVGILAISNGFFPPLYYPEISYVETSGYQLGKLSFERMINHITGTSTPADVTVKSVLVEKGSV